MAMGAAGEASAAGWEPVWSATIDASPARTFLRGACVHGRTLFVTAVVATSALSDPTPVLYALSVDQPPAAGAKRLWQGGTVLGAEAGLSNPVCGPDGISLAVRETGKGGATELIRVAGGGKATRTTISTQSSLELVALRALDESRWLLAGRFVDQLFVVTAAGDSVAIPVTNVGEQEIALDVCVAPASRSVVLLSYAPTATPAGLLTLRKWGPALAPAGTRSVRGTFGGLACSPTADEMEVLHVQPQGESEGSFVVARFGPGSTAPQAEVVDAARIASPMANGIWTEAATEWAVTNLKSPTLYEVVRKGRAKLAWRDVDPQWGGTTTPPSLAALDDGSMAVVYEAYDRSLEGLPVVLRAVRLGRK